MLASPRRVSDQACDAYDTAKQVFKSVEVCFFQAQGRSVLCPELADLCELINH